MFKWLKSFFSDAGSVPVVIDQVMSTPKKTAAKKATVKKADLVKLTKAQLEEKGREFGIEIDKRKKKDDLVKEVFNASKK